jgi:hypothetical protein
LVLAAAVVAVRDMNMDVLMTSMKLGPSVEAASMDKGNIALARVTKIRSRLVIAVVPTM